jgi:hypothetical protein
MRAALALTLDLTGEPVIVPPRSPTAELRIPAEQTDDRRGLLLSLKI